MNFEIKVHFCRIFTWAKPRVRAAGTSLGAGTRLAQNRHVFGNFDTFGDFDLLFGSAHLGLKIVEVPVRYRARTYGDTKMPRFSHGFLLLRMTALAFRRFKLNV